MTKNILTFFFTLFFCFSIFSQNKKTLSYKDFDQWKSLTNQNISNDGQWISYEINPQKGDGFLYLYNTNNQKLDSVARGKNAVFSPSGNFMAFSIVPQSDTIRTLKLQKKKAKDFPKDSLAIWNLNSGVIKKYPCVKEFKIPEKKGNWLVAQFDKSFKLLSEPDSLLNDSIKDNKEKKSKQKGSYLVYLNPISGDSILFDQTTLFEVPEYGKSLFMVKAWGDSVEETQIKVLNTNTLKIDTIFQKTGNIKTIASDNQSQQLGFVFSQDTSKTKIYDLFYWNKKHIIQVTDSASKSLPKNWGINTNGKVWFSEDCTKLFFGTGAKPLEEPKDTLTEDEKVHVDIWNWKDLRLQPMQKVNLEKDKKKAYTAVYIPSKNKITQLENEDIEYVRILNKGNTDIVIGFDSKPYLRASSWDGEKAKDLYKINCNNGTITLIKKGIDNSFSISPEGRFLAWFNSNDSIWYLTDIEKLSTIALTNQIEVPFYNELNDMPDSPDAYGIAGWSTEAKYIYIYDRYDIWKINTKGKPQPICITNHTGRNTSTTFRYEKLDKEQKFIPDNTEMILSFFNQNTKNSGYGLLHDNLWSEYINEASDINDLEKSQKSDVIIWRNGTFTKYPELYYSKNWFADIHKISVTNPQQKDYNWANIQLVEYNSLTGEKLHGLLVTPEDLKKEEKYPMLVYYYEKNSDLLNRYREPKPSRSTINWTTYASNGYVIFIPDITYKTGIPGKSAYDAIMGGVTSMINQFSFIDKDHIGLQGQSWGGYQTAYMVTQSSFFKAAMAGAPVSNMTSAYGGIRWKSGMSRMFQYEHTQSRIGGTLWDNLPVYIENSPVFFAPRIETPLLIMHNDNDGAVPWYQGIELFTALRRLDKQVWMLSYNDEEHNLTRRANEIDLSIRMMQFFDHFLKNKPAPVWMEYGVPATKKGKELGYDLVQ